jgi:hypothetical protein
LLEERVLAPEGIVEAPLAYPDRTEELGRGRGSVPTFPEDVESTGDCAIEVKESRAAHL